MRTVLSRRAEGDESANLAVDLYVRKIVKTVGGFYAILGGLDAMVFTAGVGPHSPEIRRLIAESIRHLGIEIDSSKNANCVGEVTDLTTAGSRVRTLVIATNEELAIARQVALLGI